MFARKSARLAMVALVLLGLTAFYSHLAADRQLRSELIQTTQMVAHAIDQNRLVRISNNNWDFEDNDYQLLKRQFSKIRLSDERVKFVYILHQDSLGRMQFLIDDQPEGSPDISLPFDVYDDSPKEFQNVLGDGKPLVAGPFQDRWGYFVSGAVRIQLPGTSNPSLLFVVDMDAKDWIFEVWKRSAVPIGLFILGLTLFFWWNSAQRSKLKYEAQKARLTQTEEYAQKLVVESPQPIAVTELIYDDRGDLVDFRIISANHAFGNQNNLDLSLVIGKTASQSFRILPFHEIMNLFRSVIHQGIAISKIFEIRDTNKFWLINAYPVGSGKIATLFHDLTDQKHQEKELNTLKERFELALQGSMDGIWDWNLVSQHIYLSPRWKEILGYSDRELSNTVANFQDLIHPNDRTKVDQALNTHLHDKSPMYEAEFRMLHKSGSIRWILARGKAIRDENNYLVRIAGSHTDITERKISEERLKENEANFQAFFDTMTDLIFVASPQGRILFTNKAVRETLSNSESQLTCMEILDLHPEPLRSEALEIFQAMVQGERSTCPLPLKSSFGLHIPVETRIWLGRWGQKDCIFGISKNLTQEQEAQQRFERLFRNNPSLMALTELPNREFRDINNAFLDTLGYSRQETLGHTVHELKLFLNAEQQDHISEVLEKHGSVKNQELQVRRKDGSIIDGLFSGEVIESQGKRCFLTVMIDITARKKAERELHSTIIDLESATLLANTMAAQAEAANAAKSLFLANMSHEIRTPMNGVIGLTSLLLETDLTAEQRKLLEMVRSSGDSLIVLINDILDYSKIEAGRMQIENVDFALPDLLESCLVPLVVKAEEKALRLDLNMDDQVPPNIQGDPTRIRQILTNLIGNAIKFTHEGGVTLSIQKKQDAKGHDILHFAVKDSGIGIPKDKIQMLFNKFQQVDASTTRKYGGTGLGLAISKQLTELMGGHIGVNSSLGNGTEFWFTLPLTQAVGDVVATGEYGLRESEIPDQLHLKILLAEDNPINQLVATKILGKLGCSIDVAQNGKEAIEKWKVGLYDLILMDVQMPILDGLDATKVIRNAEKIGQHQRIIAMTANAMQGDREICLKAGMDDYLTKPIDPKEIRIKLGKIVPVESFSNELDSLPSLDENSPFDSKLLIERLLGDRDVAVIVATGFIAELPPQMQQVQNAFTQNLLQETARALHALKGAASNLCANRLQSVAQDMESACKDNNIALAQKQWLLLQDAQIELVPLLEQFIAE